MNRHQVTITSTTSNERVCLICQIICRPQTTAEDLMKYKLKHLRSILTTANVTTNTCKEKRDLAELVVRTKSGIRCTSPNNANTQTQSTAQSGQNSFSTSSSTNNSNNNSASNTNPFANFMNNVQDFVNFNLNSMTNMAQPMPGPVPHPPNTQNSRPNSRTSNNTNVSLLFFQIYFIFF